MAQPAARPNLLILMADQFRSDIVGANGSPICRTPTLDRLAADGVSYLRAYCATPLCTPARGALFTGRYPHSNGLFANTQYPDTVTPSLGAGERMLFEHLAGAGYRCGYAGKWHMGVDEAREAQRHGVHDFFNAGTARRLHHTRLDLPPRDDLSGARQRTMAGERPPMSGVTPYPEPYHQDAAIAGQAAELLERYVAQGHGGPDRPFALVCSLHGPHFPIEVPEPYASLYDPAAVPRFTSFDDTFEGKPQGQRTHPWLQLGAHLSWEQWRRVIAHYWGYATYIDALMGRVLDTLEASGLSERTLVLATADHGEMAGHHRMFDKGPYFYEDVLRVPYVWRWPGHIPARTGPDAALVSHVDVAPTILELAGVSPLPGTPPFQGRSLAGVLTSPPSSLSHPPAGPWWRGGAGGGGEVFAESTPGDKPNPQIHARVVVDRRWKHVYRPDDDVTEELYDLETDPEELRNLAGDTPHRAQRDALRQRLAAWMRHTDDHLLLPS